MQKLHDAVATQIGLWDAATFISDAVDWELDGVPDYVMQRTIVADRGMDIAEADLQELFEIEPLGENYSTTLPEQ